ncbi:IS110 family transposase [Pseudonocardia sulfidoxydans NBRC 16205]|uniref:IS110 family transposase n=1 Tax=Pseudonocardia sulfidoxydans NBRC 16205 TaxID=1223511 RepID=A0A511DIY6_9PSEU|nr:IS110 family transposase [Pseudonocardia sulfidoxydans]GEL24775.1 IS110 family transposase [Pseudonocardia sulfidoxydans NBRC 16205]
MVIDVRTSVGLDVHARSVVACGLDGQTGQLFEQRLVPDPATVIDWVRALPGPAAVTYEAGPTGFGLARALTEVGIRCLVAAPSKLQRPTGDRVKTDVRDARHLARLLHLSEIVEVAVPSRELEACRDLTRSREAARRELMAARNRMMKLLLRHGIVCSGGTAWTARHEEWLRRQRLPMLHSQMAFESAYGAVVSARGRRDRLDEAIEAMVADCDLTPVVRRLGCLRGISTLTGFALAVEIGDWHRLSGRTIGSFLGLVPSEFSSGATKSRGAITKTGNGHARRLLIEAAWHHRRPYRTSAALARRWELASPAARGRAEQGNRRLHARWAGFDARRKRAVVANTAIARELAGWCWSLAVLE